jgi:integrase/recombinase XerD
MHNTNNKSTSVSEQTQMAQALTITAQQLNRVLSAAANSRHPQRNRAIILTQHLSGMRVGETAALQYGDVVDLDGTIKTEVRLTAAQTKGNRSRVVLLPERLRAELAHYAASHPNKRADRPLFFTQRSAGFTADTLTHIVNALYAKARIDGGSSHSGRRTFITTLAEQGDSARVLQQLAGHTNLSTTQRYIDVKPSMLRAAVELV